MLVRQEVKFCEFYQHFGMELKSDCVCRCRSYRLLQWQREASSSYFNMFSMGKWPFNAVGQYCGLVVHPFVYRIWL